MSRICVDCEKTLPKKSFKGNCSSCTKCMDTLTKPCERCGEDKPYSAYGRKDHKNCMKCARPNRPCAGCGKTKAFNMFEKIDYATCKQCVEEGKNQEKKCELCGESFIAPAIDDINCVDCKSILKEDREIAEEESNEDNKKVGDRTCRFCGEHKQWKLFSRSNEHKCRECKRGIDALKKEENKKFINFPKRVCSGCHVLLAEPIFEDADYDCCAFCIQSAKINSEFKVHCGHRNQPSQCKLCPDAIGLCHEHKIPYYRCYPCNPKSVAFCDCKRLKYDCILHAGRNKCDHGTWKRHCDKCNPPGYIASQVHSEIGHTLEKQALNKKKKYLQCTGFEFLEHIQSLFEDGMTLENHGEWHVDHIIALMHDNPTVEDVKARARYSNTRPLWAEQNAKKGVHNPEGHEDIRANQKKQKTT